MNKVKKYIKFKKFRDEVCVTCTRPKECGLIFLYIKTLININLEEYEFDNFGYYQDILDKGICKFYEKK